MQDKNKRELDPALVDNAWLKMEQQLDEAMPQRKRPVVWWWVGLLGLFILFVNVLLLSNEFNSAADQESTEIKEQRPVAADHAPLTNETPPSAGKELTKGNDLPAKPVTPSAKTNSQQRGRDQRQPEAGRFSKATPAGKPQSAAAASSNGGGAVTERKETLRDDTPVTTIVPKISANNNPGNLALQELASVKTVPQEKGTIAEDQSVPSVATTRALLPLMPLPPAETSLLRLSTPDLVLNTTKVKIPSPWRYFMETQGGFSLSQTDYTSLSFGAGLQRKLGAKLNAEMGLQYQWNSRSLLNVNDNLEGGFVEDESEVFLGNQAAINLDLAFRNLRTERVNFIVGSVYQITPRLGIGLGLQASYYTSAYADFGNAAALSPQPVTESNNGERVDLYQGTVAVYNYDLTTNAASDPFALEASRWQWSLNSSLRYRFAKKWETNLQYQQHLTKWPNNENAFGGLSALQLGLRFYLR